MELIMNNEIKPNGLMAVHGLLKQLEDEVTSIEDRKEILKQDMEKFSLANDKVSWSEANEKLKNLDRELKWCFSQKKSLENKTDRDTVEQELEEKRQRNEALKQLNDDRQKLRQSFDRFSKNFVKVLKEADDLHVRRVTQVPDVKETERQAFLPDTFFEDFLKVLNSYPEAQRFLKIANSMHYPAVPCIRKMKDYDTEFSYEQIN
jgi:DNA repair exonuclease SbcCD ATPase subunit